VGCGLPAEPESDEALMRIIWTGLCMLFAACGGDGPAALGPDLGIYSLRTVDGRSVPTATGQWGNWAAEVLSAEVTLESGGQFRLIERYRLTRPGDVELIGIPIDGAYSTTPTGTLRFVPEPPTHPQKPFTMTWSGASLVWVRDGPNGSASWEFRRD
jgi:hypothetical protein